ncbi:hypothetical protein PAT3040_02865 [Paenibacillus agaridevorans]|uniref:Uncharacterized protein n=1 Tax=Paenibacillus agaridevorans TaxID=171404 RepID=A0A2R5ETC0_9BACL|nr:hypothetical protein PAT3040_02865 [Paenibacillus agaridevorans]
MPPFIPDPDLPPILPLRLKFLSRVDDMNGAAGLYLAAVPAISFAAGELVARRRHQHLIGRLPRASFMGLQLPKKAGSPNVDSDGIDFVFRLAS